MEDVLRRLGNVETDVSELKSQVSGILTIIPHLATKADVMDVKIAIADLRGELAAGLSQARADLAAGLGQARADLAAGLGQARADLAATETVIIKWIVATVLASAGLAFTIAKFVH